MTPRAAYLAGALSFLLRPDVVAAAVVLVSVAGGIQRVMLGPSLVDGRTYTHYNNYVVFTDSFTHLRQGLDLYVLYPQEHWDLYKYSPTFALLMAPFAALPDNVGVVIWGLVGSLALFAGIWRLPVADERSRMAAMWLLMLPMLQSLQNAQSNSHVAGLVLLAAASLEAGALLWAALAIALGFYVKIYSVVALALIALYPGRVRCGAYFVTWMIALGLLPLLLVPPSQLVFLYHSWGRLLASDEAASTGISVTKWLQSWFGFAAPKVGMAAIGLGITLLPLIRARAYALLRFRMVFLAALLIWMVIFNHKAEPNTFVIAVAGVAVWYIAGRRTPLRVAILSLVLVLTCLSTTTVFPMVVRQALIQQYALRVAPCIFAWIAAVIELMRVTELLPFGAVRQTR